MGRRWSALVAGTLVLSTSAAHAVVPRAGRRVAADELTAMPAAGTKPLRTQRMLRAPSRLPAAWRGFAAATGGTWSAVWDAATGVPSRLWGPGIAAPGAVADPAVAERVARRWLADHVALLAPGAAPSDFELVANHSDGSLRSVGFAQRASGRLVVGGQVSFRFKADRLFLIGSEALPAVAFSQPRARLARAQLAARATSNLRRELALPDAPVAALAAPGARDEEVVLPLVGDSAVYGYRLATRVELDGGADGRYLAYVDPGTGDVLAVRQQNTYATGTVLYRGVTRHPGRGRADLPASRAFVTIGATPQTTSPAGGISWATDDAQLVTTTVQGAHVTIVNKKSNGVTPTAQLSILPGGQLVWDASANAEDDAQLVTYLAANTVKEYVRANIDSHMPRIDEAITANVNIAQNCNAFFDGKTINFFHASSQCQNTGLLEDVVFHEFGHALHAAEIIPGVGGFDGAMSEGAADFLAASITKDSGMGRGFFYTDSPLRELDPPSSEFSWPRDISEIHATGRIFGGVFWDLRKAAIAALGEGPGVALVNKLYLGALRGSVSIPTSLYAVLATDDDDGDLTNGTPNECLIRDAYGRHGLRTAAAALTAPGTVSDLAASSAPVRIDLTGLSPTCAGDRVSKVTLAWRATSVESPLLGEAPLTAESRTSYTGTVPLQRDDVMLYHAIVEFEDGSHLTIPDNLGLPYYAVYQGATVPLYCTSFDTDPFAEGWTTATDDPDAPSPWQWGPLPGTGATDPRAAYSGTNVLGMALGGDYGAKQSSVVRLPDIDVGQWSDVRLQFRRWLAVEDSHYDKARVTVDGEEAWINYTQDAGDSSSIHHIDREWAFHDVPVSAHAYGHVLQLAFELTSDEGLHLGGWHLDDVCVVANVGSVCGDGAQSPTEECDDGEANANTPGAHCRTYCKLAGCGDGVIDGKEECDEGRAGTDRCSPHCTLIGGEGGGCCSTGSSPVGPAGLSALVALGLLRRRRSAARRPRP